MFTGLIERTGKVISLTAPADAAIMQLIVDPGKDYPTERGDSVAVNGCCLTVTSNRMGMLAFDVSRETLECTSLGDVNEGREVNLERALRVGDRLGGHMVTGHIDGTCIVTTVKKQSEGWSLEVSVPQPYGRYLIHKGSICLDGVSLTVNSVDDDGDETIIQLTLIPTTVSLTTFKHLVDGARLNFEVDPIGKYVERLIRSPED